MMTINPKSGFRERLETGTYVRIAGPVIQGRGPHRRGLCKAPAVKLVRDTAASRDTGVSGDSQGSWGICWHGYHPQWCWETPHASGPWYGQSCTEPAEKG